MSKIILGLVALPGAGKTTVARILQEDGGFTIISVSNMIREAARERGLNQNDRNVFRSIRREMGDEAISKWVIDKIDGSKSTRFVVDAVRQLILDDSLREHFGESYKLLSIHAGQDVRYSAQLSGNKEGEFPRSSFIANDRIELGHITDAKGEKYDVRELFSRAREHGYEINNGRDRNIEELKQKLHEIVLSVDIF